MARPRCDEDRDRSTVGEPNAESNRSDGMRKTYVRKRSRRLRFPRKARSSRPRRIGFLPSYDGIHSFYSISEKELLLLPFYNQKRASKTAGRNRPPVVDVAMVLVRRCLQNRGKRPVDDAAVLERRCLQNRGKRRAQSRHPRPCRRDCTWPFLFCLLPYCGRRYIANKSFFFANKSNFLTCLHKKKAHDASLFLV